MKTIDCICDYIEYYNYMKKTSIIGNIYRKYFIFLSYMMIYIIIIINIMITMNICYIYYY